MLGSISSLLCDCHSPIGDRVCSAGVEIEALKVHFSKSPLSLSVFPILKEVSAEADRPITMNLCAAHAGILCFVQIMAFILGPRECEILCIPFKSSVSVLLRN